ncbi:hypothetical protein DITRI_Ditri20bG0095700 [Diplodiscus trichospermus]
MGRKEGRRQDVESFTKGINGRKQHQTQAQALGQSSNGVPTAGNNDKPGIINLNHRHKFSGGKRHGEASGRRRSKGIGKTHKGSSLRKREKKKRLRDEVEKMEAFVLEMRTELSRDKPRLVEGKARLKELETLIAQKREQNRILQLMMNL